MGSTTNINDSLVSKIVDTKNELCFPLFFMVNMMINQEGDLGVITEFSGKSI